MENTTQPAQIVAPVLSAAETQYEATKKVKTKIAELQTEIAKSKAIENIPFQIPGGIVNLTHASLEETVRLAKYALTASNTEVNKVLGTNLPDTIKGFPIPEILEMCRIRVKVLNLAEMQIKFAKLEDDLLKMNPDLHAKLKNAQMTNDINDALRELGL